MGGGVGDDDAVDEFGAGGEHARVVGGVDRLGQVAPARQRGDAVLAEELDGGQDVGAGRQQSAVAEGAEDAGVVGGGGAQVEELPFGGGDGLVEQFPQFLGEVVELFGGEGAAGGVAQCRGGALGAPGPSAPSLSCRPADGTSVPVLGPGTPARAAPDGPVAAAVGVPGRPSSSARRSSVARDSASLSSASWARVAAVAASAERAAVSSARDSAEAASRARSVALRAASRAVSQAATAFFSASLAASAARAGSASGALSSSQPARTASAVSCSTSVSRWRRCPASLRARCASVAAAVASRWAASPVS